MRVLLLMKTPHPNYLRMNIWMKVLVKNSFERMEPFMVSILFWVNVVIGTAREFVRSGAEKMDLDTAET